MNRVYLISAYGPYESSVCVAGDAKLGQPSKIGRAVGSVAWIVDEACHERLVSIGCIGEILTEGPLVARGYLNDQMKTAKSFTEDPPWLVQRQGDAFPGRKRRLYKSGDLGRYNADGSIQFLEREDLQKKIRGQRIEVGDVESHLRQLLPTEMSVAVDVIVPVRQPRCAEARWIPEDQ